MSARRKPGNWNPWLMFAGLAAATLLAYQPAWHGTLLWDDAQHLTAPHLRAVSGLAQIWFQIGRASCRERVSCCV